MNEPFRFDYYYGAESDQFSFVRIPKLLLNEPRFQDISYGAKVTYAVLLDRMNLSLKNGWHDEKNRVYIRYKVSDLTDVIGRSEDTVSRYLKELEDLGTAGSEHIVCKESDFAFDITKEFYALDVCVFCVLSDYRIITLLVNHCERNFETCSVEFVSVDGTSIRRNNDQIFFIWTCKVNDFCKLTDDLV